jgi:hypothetical protein
MFGLLLHVLLLLLLHVLLLLLLHLLLVLFPHGAGLGCRSLLETNVQQSSHLFFVQCSQLAGKKIAFLLILSNTYQF